MSLRKYVRQLKPVQENYIAPEVKIQTLLEGFTTPISTAKEVTSFAKNFDYSTKDLNELFIATIE